MKGSIGMQFNWIFILIVGIALLGIFFMQYQSSAQKSRYEASMNMRGEIHSLLSSPSADNVKEIPLGLMSLLYNCQDDRSNFYLGKERLPVETTYLALHAPKRITSTKLYVQVIDNIPILTGADHVYVFVNDNTDKILKYYNLFEGPKKLVDYGEVGSEPPTGTKLRYTLVYYFPEFNPSDPPAIDYNGQVDNFDIVIISPPASGDELLLYFWSRHGRDPQHYPFINDAEAIGGIVDSDGELYECIHDKYMQKEKFNLLLLQKKIEAYIDHPEVSDSCETVMLYINSVVSDALDVFEDSNAEEQLVSKKRDIEKYNVDLARINCPIIQ